MNNLSKNLSKIIVIVFMLLSITGCTKKDTTNKQIYYGVYNFEMGSKRVKVYNNGKVYEDIEIEEPNHVEKYKYLKTLDNKKLKELKKLLAENDKTTLDEDIAEIIYGCKQFNNTGNCA